MSEKLFRSEALRFVGQHTFGDLIVVRPLHVTIITTLLICIVSSAMLYLWFGEYSRKETVRGFLEPQAGVVNVYAQSAGGVIDAIHVKSGDLVQAGQPLIYLTSTSVNAHGQEATEEILNRLESQRAELLLQAERNKQFYAQEENRLKERLSELESEQQQQLQFLQLQKSRVALVKQLLNSMSKLRSSGALPESQWLQTQSNRLEQEKEVLAIQNRLLQLASARKGAEHELEQLPTKAANQALQTSLEVSSIEQRLVQTRAQRDEVLLAPITGRVSAVQARVGAGAQANQSMLTILPNHSALECILLLPSSAVGFVESGQTIRLKFDAFPHQQFGTFPARLHSISENAVNPQDLRAPIKVGAPVYLARVQLDTESVTVRGQERPLQTGMMVSADIILENRSLLDWLLEPLYSVRGKNS